MNETQQLKEMLESIAARLERIEAASGIAANSRNAEHPSLRKFKMIEEIADEVINGVRKEKACTFEPNAKPCDNCSMCSSLGF